MLHHYSVRSGVRHMYVETDIKYCVGDVIEIPMSAVFEGDSIVWEVEYEL